MSSKQYRWLLTLVYGYKMKMLAYFILEVLAILSSLMFIFFSKRTIDVALKVVEGDINKNILLVIVTAISGVIIRSVSQWINQKTQISMTLDLQYKTLEKQMLSVWRVIKKWDTGDLLVRLNSDCTEIAQMLCSTWIAFLITTIKIVASFIFLYSMDSVLAWVILGITPVFLLTKVYFRKMKTLNVNVKNAESEMGATTQENLRYRVILRALGALSERLQLFKNKQSNYKDLRYNYLGFTITSQSFMRSAMTIGYLVAFSWGIYRLKSLEISYGTMTAFLQLVNQIQSPILTLGAFFPAFVRFKVSMERIEEISHIQQDNISEAIKFKKIDSLIFENVSFKYEEEEIIKNLNATFYPGEITAVLGASGTGKTTLIRLILGMITPNKGNIYLLGDNSKNILSSAHIENFSYVPQGNTLLSGTIRSNLIIGEKDISEEKLKEVLFLSCAEFVYDLPNGIDTVIGESGLGLSEGQAQRISIARALLRNRKIWLFDEATSALDAENTKLFLNRIKYLIKDKIVIFVTHDMNVSVACHNQLLIN